MNNSKQVLLVDDDAIINLIDSRVIKLNNTETKVTSFSSGYDALSFLNDIIKEDKDNFPETIFLDINMPEMDGWEFLDEMKKFPDEVLDKCKTFMLTSSIDVYDIIKAKGNPLVNDFISKPLNLEKLNLISSEDHKRFSIADSLK